jgi:hypothetical protein
MRGFFAVAQKPVVNSWLLVAGLLPGGIYAATRWSVVRSLSSS